MIQGSINFNEHAFFAYPEKTAKILSKYSDWEFLEFRIKGSYELIACVWSFLGEDYYCPLILGLNYDYIKSHIYINKLCTIW